MKRYVIERSSPGVGRFDRLVAGLETGAAQGVPRVPPWISGNPSV